MGEIEKDFSAKEKIACLILSNLKHDGKAFIPCKFNDFLLNVTNDLIRVDPIALFEKVTKVMVENNKT